VQSGSEISGDPEESEIKHDEEAIELAANDTVENGSAYSDNPEETGSEDDDDAAYLVKLAAKLAEESHSEYSDNPEETESEDEDDDDAADLAEDVEDLLNCDQESHPSSPLPQTTSPVHHSPKPPQPRVLSASSNHSRNTAVAIEDAQIATSSPRVNNTEANLGQPTVVDLTNDDNEPEEVSCK
jgi:hypothetical protein